MSSRVASLLIVSCGINWWRHPSCYSICWHSWSGSTKM